MYRWANIVLDMRFTEPLEEMFSSSKLLVLDFAQITKDAIPKESIQHFFEDCQKKGVNPRTPESRQKFNDRLIRNSGFKYLIGNYGEDRSVMLSGTQIAAEGRTIHIGTDVFASGLESVYCPCDGEIVRTGYEKRAQGYGHYLIVKPANINNLYLFFGHLGKELPPVGGVRRGEKIAWLGDFKNNENGGWSRHLHLQMMRNLPPASETPIGYSTKADFELNSRRYPNPLNYFKNLHF